MNSNETGRANDGERSFAPKYGGKEEAVPETRRPVPAIWLGRVFAFINRG
jgi:hypothetical protein